MPSRRPRWSRRWLSRVSPSRTWEILRRYLEGNEPVAAATQAARAQKEEQQAVGLMPRPSFGLLGATGGIARAHLIVRLAVQNANEAERAAKIIVYRLHHTQSLATKKPFPDLLTLASAEGQADPPIARAEFASRESGGANLWAHMLSNRDLGLIGWG